MLETLTGLAVLWLTISYIAACSEIRTLRREAPGKLAVFQDHPWSYILVSLTIGPLIYLAALVCALHR